MSQFPQIFKKNGRGELHIFGSAECNGLDVSVQKILNIITGHIITIYPKGYCVGCFGNVYTNNLLYDCVSRNATDLCIFTLQDGGA